MRALLARWGVRLSMAAAAALLAAWGGPAAAEDCAARVSAACAERFGAGALPADEAALGAACREQWRAYRACIGALASQSGGGPSPQADPRREAEAKDAYNAVKNRGSAEALELVAQRFAGTFWGDLAAKDAAALRGDGAPAAGAAQDQPARPRAEAWAVECRAAGGCFMERLARNATGEPIGAFRVRKIADGGAIAPASEPTAVAEASILVPSAMVVEEGVGLAIDGVRFRTAAVVACTERGCLSRPSLSAAEIDRLKRGRRLEAIVLTAAGGGLRSVVIPFPLDGFAAAYDGTPAPE